MYKFEVTRKWSDYSEVPDGDSIEWRYKDVPLSGITVSGYGKKIVTPYMVYWREKWRRVYAASYSNCATCYVISKGEKYIVDRYDV